MRIVFKAELNEHHLPGFVSTRDGRVGKVQGRLQVLDGGRRRLLITCKDEYTGGFFSAWADECFVYDLPALPPGVSPFVEL